MPAGFVALAVRTWIALGAPDEDRAQAIARLGHEISGLPAAAASASWITHVTIPWERLGDVATRYGVGPDEVARWNELSSPAADTVLERDLALRIRPKRFPPPRQALTYVVAEDDTWAKIARRFDKDPRTLKAWNVPASRRKLAPGTELVVWMDSSLPGLGSGTQGPPIPEIQRPMGGIPKGRPSRGRLLDGVSFPASPLYTLRLPSQAYGSGLTVYNTQLAIATFRHDSGYPGEIVISAVSRERGGRLPPHQSHQNGRDVDVWLPAMPHARPGFKPEPDEVDWHAAWQLIAAFVATGEVKRIYLDYAVFRRLRRAARELGVPWDQFRQVVSYGGIVAHAADHTGHIHVRFRCGPGAPKCRG